MMIDVVVKSHTAENVAGLARFFARYSKAFPDAKLRTTEFYTFHPLLEDGKNVFCAMDAQGRTVGFAPLFPTPVGEDSPPSDPHHIWMIVIADPERPDADEIRELLLDEAVARAHAIKASFAPRQVRLAADYMSSQRPDIEYLLGRGFEQFEGMYVMVRDVLQPVTELPLPHGITVKPWKMPSEDEQRQYLRAFNRCFPSNPQTLEALQFFMRSPMWAVGTAMTAFDQSGEVVGSIVVYCGADRRWGVTDEVFVVPEWQGQGIAKRLIGEGIEFLANQGIARVQLEVRRSNTPALALYRSLGYKVTGEEVLLGLRI